MDENKKPLHQAVYNDVLQEYKANSGETYEEVKNAVTAEYERRVKAYLPTEGIWEGDATEQQLKNRQAFIKKYKDRNKLNKFE